MRAVVHDGSDNRTAGALDRAAVAAAKLLFEGGFASAANRMQKLGAGRHGARLRARVPCASSRPGIT